MQSVNRCFFRKLPSGLALSVVGMSVFGLLAPLSIANASDSPSFIDERQPTQVPGLEQIRESEARRSATRVTLPRVAGAIRRETVVPVAHLDFRGGTVFELEDLAGGLRPMLGQRVTVGELIDAVEAITRRYQEAGYPLSYAYLPDNNFRNGVVTVVVVEGYIARTELDIDKAAVASRVQRLAARIVDERPLTRATFERYTTLMERIPGARLAINAPVPRTPSGGTTLRVEERAMRSLDGGFSLQGGDEDDVQLLANLTLQSNTRHAERLSLAALVPTETDDEFYAAEYQQELGVEGLRLSLAASRFETEESTGISLLGNQPAQEEKVTERYRAGLDYPLYLSRRFNWFVGGQLDHHQQRSLFVEQGLALLEQRLDFSAIELNTRLRRASEERILEWRSDLRQGIDLGGNRNRLSSATGSVEQPEDLHFTRLGSEARWVEQLASRWRLTSRVAGFWSDDTLPSPEQGNYGGSRFGRGYGDSQAEGDYGVAGEIELRYLQPVESDWVSSVEPYLLVDGASTRFNESDTENEIASAVAGVELSRGSLYRLGVEYAQPIGDRDLDTDSRDGRINARISWNLGG